MAITSGNNKKLQLRYGNTQFRYAIVYVLITLAVLLFLNFYCSETTEQIFHQGKKTAILEKCRLAASEFSELDVLNQNVIEKTILEMPSLSTTRIVVTDSMGSLIFDSTKSAQPGTLMLLPEIVESLPGNDVFSWSYNNGVMASRAAVPIMSYGNLTGCVYIMERDTSQGTLMQSLQRNIFTITLFLEIIVVLVSVGTALIFTGKFRKILASMRIISGGDYTHRLSLRGRDELNLLADEFNALTERLMISEQKRARFVSDASHELKTPLASIKLLTDSILQNEMDIATIREFVEDIGNEADRLNRMSQKLLSLSRIDTQVDGECEIVGIIPTIERVTRMLSPLANENQITIHHDFKSECPILILEDDLYQIIFNLTENGIKYNTSGGSLTISLHRESDNAILQVIDTGMGIPEDALGHIFERFFRVDKARSRKSGGSGLGLSIVRNMVERNDGTISVESTPGKGSVFTIVFPIFDTEEEVS